MNEQFREGTTNQESELEKQFAKAMAEMDPEVTKLLIKIEAEGGFVNNFPGVIGGRTDELLKDLQKKKIVEEKDNRWQLTEEFRNYWVSQAVE